MAGGTYQVFFDEVLVFEHDLLSCHDRSVTPCREGRLGRGHSRGHLILGTLGDTGYHFIGCLQGQADNNSDKTNVVSNSGVAKGGWGGG